MSKKIYRTIIRFEVLSDEPINDEPLSLHTLNYMTQDGEWSGRFLESNVIDEELSGDVAIKAVEAQGSDPEFFGLK